MKTVKYKKSNCMITFNDKTWIIKVNFLIFFNMKTYYIKMSNWMKNIVCCFVAKFAFLVIKAIKTKQFDVARNFSSWLQTERTEADGSHLPISLFETKTPTVASQPEQEPGSGSGSGSDNENGMSKWKRRSHNGHP